MQIDRDHEAVKRLTAMWAEYKGKSPYLRERRSEDHQRALRKILDGALLPFKGELMLVYRRFLTMKPSGVHSFAHGSEMVSDTVYWLTAARIEETKVTYVKSRLRTWGDEYAQTRIRIASRYEVPASFVSHLRPRYRSGKHEPHFVIEEPSEADSNRQEKTSVDIAVLGQHLFRLNPGKNDWYTQVEIVFGNVSVEKWLKAHDSEDVLPQLSAR